jgi:hypothetical protein
MHMKKTYPTTLALAAAALALLAGSATANAQDAAPHVKVIELVPGAVLLVTPDGPAAQRQAWQVEGLPMPRFGMPGFAMPGFAMPGFAMPGFAMAPLPDPETMLQQIDRMMARTMQALDGGQAIDAAGPGAMPAAAGPGATGQVAGVVVTSFSDGTSTCTRRVVYPAGGGVARVEVSASGPACAQAGFATPAAQPAPPPFHRLPLHTIEVKHQAPQRLAPIVLADAAG